MNYIKLVLLTIVLSAASLITSGCAGGLYLDGDSGIVVQFDIFVICG
jgi:hypothetical protein